MRHRSRASSARGTTLIEIMMAAAVLLIAMVALVSIMNQATHATAIAHRRTVAAFTRQYLLDRLAVTPRDRLALLPHDDWRVDACYDVNSQIVASNPSLVDDFEATTGCAGAAYRTWVRIEPAAAPAAFPGARAWRARAYAERTDPGCDVNDRYSSIHCVAADVLLTD